MLRRAANPFPFFINQQKLFSSCSTQQSLYSFLNPSIFTTPPKPPQPPQKSQPTKTPPKEKSELETTLQKSLITQNTHLAWSTFKSLLTHPTPPNPSLTNSLIQHLTSLNDPLNLKRAYATLLYSIQRGTPNSLHLSTFQNLLQQLCGNGNVNAAVALVKCLFENRVFVPFEVWGGLLGDGCRGTGLVVGFLRVFEESCRVAVEEGVEFMRPGLDGFNLALEGWCREMESVEGAERVVGVMSEFGVRPDGVCFGFLGYLYALKGVVGKVVELEELVREFGVADRGVFYKGVVSGFVKSGNLESAKEWVLRWLRDGGNWGSLCFDEFVKGFLVKGKDGFKGLAGLIFEAQELEVGDVEVERSIGYCIVNACVDLGLLDKAHSILDEMNAQGGSLGLGVYVPILKAYCKERRTAEATQLVMDINGSGLQLDVGTYDALIEASMTCQDFQSAFALFRDMREGRLCELKGSYLTIMTGLMENQRPELMAAFLDEVVEDPRVEVSSHDWNSIIHAFCKAGRLEDARRTFRRMMFLQYHPNSQTYLSLINGYVAAEKYFNVLMLWNEIKRKISSDGEKGIKFDHALIDAFLYALVKGGFFDAVMQVVEKCQEMKVFVDKWKYKQAFMENHKKLKVSKLRRKNFRKMEAVIAFKNWAGLNG